jgi:hypothetical protein
MEDNMLTVFTITFAPLIAAYLTAAVIVAHTRLNVEVEVQV